MRFRRTRFLLLFVSIVSLSSPLLAAGVPSDPDEALDMARKEKKAGVEDLNKAREGGRRETVLARSAMRHFEKAQELYAFYLDEVGEIPKVEEEMSELQSLLYWCRKMTPLREDPAEAPEPEMDDSGGDDGGASAQPHDEPPIEDTPAEPSGPPAMSREQEARRLFEEAERFAGQHPDQVMQIVARYFRISDGFRDTSFASRALEKAMKYARGFQKDAGSEAEPGKRERLDPTMLRLRLRHDEPDVRISAINDLVASLGKEAIVDLHELFQSEEHPEVRETVFKHLVDFKSRKTQDAFKKFCTVEKTHVAKDLMRLISEIGRDKHVRYMIYAVLYNEKRIVAPYGLYRSGDNIDGFVSRFKSAYGYGLRSYMLSCIRKMDKEGTDGILDLFRTRGAATREAILTVGALGSVDLGKKVIIYLNRGKGNRYRGEALGTLKSLGDPMIPYLIKAVSNPSQKHWAAWLLRDMTGQPYGGSPSQWWRWYRQQRRR